MVKGVNEKNICILSPPEMGNVRVGFGGGCDCKRGSRKYIIHNSLIGVNVWRAVFKGMIYKAIVIVGVLPFKMMLINT